MIFRYSYRKVIHLWTLLILRTSDYYYSVPFIISVVLILLFVAVT